MLLLGLTGPSGAGKGYVCTCFLRHGIPSVDCDAVTKRLYLPGAPCTLELAQAFGQDILASDGTLLRRVLAQRAFADPRATQRLNEITHPHILRALEAEIVAWEAKDVPALILDAPTLLESGLSRRCDHVLCVLAPKELRRQRILQRDQLTETQADTRLCAQKSDDFYRKASQYVIYNDGIADCEAQVQAILQALQLWNTSNQT